MGWTIIFVLPELIASIPPFGMVLLTAGGVIYTIGGIIYAIKPNLFKHQATTGFGNHELFHLFVNAGALCHLLCIFFFII